MTAGLIKALYCLLEAENEPLAGEIKVMDCMFIIVKVYNSKRLLQRMAVLKLLLSAGGVVGRGGREFSLRAHYLITRCSMGSSWYNKKVRKMRIASEIQSNCSAHHSTIEHQ